MAGQTAKSNLRFARLLGFDFLRDRNGHWWLIEVNDVPANLCGADKLATDAFGTSRILIRVANELASAPSDGAVVILRPSKTCDKYLGDANADEDCQELWRLVRNLGRECVLATPSQLDTIDGLRLRDGTGIAAAFRRTRLRPDCAPISCTINPALTSYVCRDKLLAPSALCNSQLPSVPTVPAGHDFQLPRSETGFLICKPRFGSGSRGIHRIRHDDISRDALSVGHVLQPWIEPDTVKIDGRPYYFDVRVLVFDGEVLGAYARTAAAPVGGIAKGLALEWLTTTGRRLPIQLATSLFSQSAVVIDDFERTLLCNVAKEFTQNIEEAVEYFQRSEAHGFYEEDVHPLHNDRAVLYVGASDTQSLTSSIAAVGVASEYLPSTGICDIEAVSGDWDELVESSGWELMPQLIAGGEQFLGSRVIDEAIRSGEVSRAVLRSNTAAWECTDSTSHIELLSHGEHEAEVWGVTASSDGSVRASCSADGSVCVFTSKGVRRYRIGPRWINAVSLSPCGRLLAFGTSEPATYLASLEDSAICHVTKLTGNVRWVNGVLALSEDRVITCSSDGRLTRWGTNGTLLTAADRKSRGHVLGMLPSRETSRFYVWSSDGVISVHSDSDLVLIKEWCAPTKRYVTTATELSINGKLEYFAVDVRGKLFTTLSSTPIYDAEERVWAICPDEQTQALTLLTVRGVMIQVRLNESGQISAKKTILTSLPTACRSLSNGQIFIGFSCGKVTVC